VTGGGDPVRVDLTRATRDAVDLAMHAEAALGRSFHREIERSFGAPPPADH
jgi:hypothetical protein